MVKEKFGSERGENQTIKILFQEKTITKYILLFCLLLRRVMISLRRVLVSVTQNPAPVFLLLLLLRIRKIELVGGPTDPVAGSIIIIDELIITIK